LTEHSKENNFKKTALITGASSGIGLAISYELAARNFDLILVSNQEKELNDESKKISHRFQVKTFPVFMDLAEANAAKNLYDWCLEQKLEVDILVNNAGMYFFGEAVEAEIEKAREMTTLHTTTPSLLCTLFGKEMKKRRYGHILNISSLSAFLPYPGIAYYSSTKNFLKSFSRSLRTEMIDYNVNVTCVCPGSVSTRLYDLKDSDRRKALRLGIMMSAEKLASTSVKALFKKKSVIVPGFVNRLTIFIANLVPHSIILLIRRYSKYLPPDKK
jgi:short-subunit dehydrogenase